MVLTTFLTLSLSALSPPTFPYCFTIFRFVLMQAMLYNDILGVERDMTEFGLVAGEDFGGLALDTTEISRTLDELVGPATLV